MPLPCSLKGNGVWQSGIQIKPSKYERSYRILEYLKKNTDQEHKVKQSDLRKIEYLKQYIGNKETFNDTIVNMQMP